MKRYILNIIITSLVIFGLSNFLPHINVTNFVSAIWFAIVLSFLNVFIRPILVILSLPLTLITFGFFLIIVNTIVIILADKLIDGIEIHGFWYAVLFSLCLSAVQSLIEPQPQRTQKN
ncbi:MAG: phage holin family protein [Capnocytophaga sp.]|nr:phage holin family protein [Capnocytophaga sp.]